jgi:hypothetical protein
MGSLQEAPPLDDGPPPELVTYVNGVRRSLPPARGEATVLQYLRGAPLAPPGASAAASAT